MGGEYRVERWGGSVLPDGETLRRLMAGEGYSVFLWSDGPGTKYELHEHGTDESHWIVSGKLELDVHGVGVIVLNSGDRDFMPAGTSHSARVIGSEPVVYIIGEKR